MISGAKCSLCGVFYPDSKSEIWKWKNKEVGVFNKNVILAVLFFKTAREFEVCEICYANGKLESALNREQLCEAYYQFGNEFSSNGQYEKAKLALSKSLGIKESADCLASLGYVENYLGNPNRAIELYNRALLLDANHFVARENLKNLISKN